MEISARFKNEFADHLRGYLPPVIVAGEAFDLAVEQELAELAQLADEKVCLARRNAMAPGCDPSDLAERVFTLSDGCEVIAGARFMK